MKTVRPSVPPHPEQKLKLLEGVLAIKSVFYDYENEVRFVCAAESAIMKDAGGVLIPVNAADFVLHIDYSPHFRNKEKPAVSRVLESLRSAGHKVDREPLGESDKFWGTPFTSRGRDENPPPDLS